MEYADLDVVLAGFDTHRVRKPIDRLDPPIPCYTLWFVTGARYRLQFPDEIIERTISGALLFRPGPFRADLISPEAVAIVYLRFSLTLFGIDLCRLFEIPQFIELPESSRARSLCSEAILEYRRKRDPMKRLAAHGLFLQSLAWLFREMRNERPPSGGSALDPLVLWALRVIKQRMGQPISVETLATEVGTHPSHLWRLFQTHLGMSPSQYIRLARMERAKELLRNPAISVANAGMMVGYQDTSAFIRAFKQVVGVTPSAYRQSLEATEYFAIET